MSVRIRGIAVFVSAAVVAVPLGGCGKAKPKIPLANARDLNALLRRVESETKAKKCTAVPRLLAELGARVDALPPKTDPDIRGTLHDGVANLSNLVSIKCATVKPTPPPQTQTQTQTQPPPTTTTTTTPPTTSTTTPSTGSTQTKPHTSPQTQPNTSGGSPSGNVGGGLGGNGPGK